MLTVLFRIVLPDCDLHRASGRRLETQGDQGHIANVGSNITFQFGSNAVEHLAEQLSKYPGQIIPKTITGLPKYTACVRLLFDGMPSKPFSMQTLPPPINEIDPERAEIIKRVTQRSFGNVTVFSSA